MTSRAMSNPLLSSYSSCFVFTKHPVQPKTVTTYFQNIFFSKKGNLSKRAGVWTPWTPPGSATACHTGGTELCEHIPATRAYLTTYYSYSNTSLCR